MPKSKVRRKKKQAQRRAPTAPEPQKHRGPSPTWYVALMFGLMAIGTLIIILNYIGLTPGETSNLWLVLGLAGIAGGFAMTLNFH